MPNKIIELDNFLKTTCKKLKFSESQAFHVSGKGEKILRQKRGKFFSYTKSIILI